MIKTRQSGLQIISKILKIAKISLISIIYFFIISNTDLVTVSLHASFETTGIGARATGLSNAFTGDADDVYAIYYNPAGLVQVELPEFSSYYGKLHTGLSDGSNIGNNFFAYAHPLNIGRKFSAGDSNLSSNLKNNNYIGTVGIGYQEFKLDSLYKETSITLSYARIFMPKVYVGLSVKSLRVSYGSDMYTQNAISLSGRSRGGIDPLFDSGRSKRALSYDLGVLYRLNEEIKIGLLLANLNQPDISLKSTGDKVNLCSKLGVSGNFSFGKVNVDLAREKRVGGSTDTNLLVGYENWLNIGRYGEMGMRCGFGEGSRQFRRVSMGFSYRVNMVQMDYGFSMPLRGIEDTMGTHRLAMTFRFGKEVEDEDLGELLEREQRLFIEAKKAMKEASEEKKRLEFELKRMKAELDGIVKGELRAKKKAIARLEFSIDKAKAKYAEAFKIAKKFYSSKILKGINLRERIVILEKVVAKYRNVGVDVTAMARELKSKKRDLRRKQEDYNMAVKYYRLMVNRGASARERRDILNKLIKKYSRAGIDLRDVKNELIKLGRK